MVHNNKKYFGINNKYRRSVGILFGSLLLLLSYMVSKKSDIFLFILAASCLLIALAIFKPQNLDGLAKFWHQFALLLNKFVSPMLFSALFVALMPLFIIEKIKRKLKLKPFADDRKNKGWQKILSNIDFGRPF